MRLRTITFAALCLLANLAVAQRETDILKYSQTFMKGSARFTAMGGAFGALGGDMSSFMINPAGVGVYRSSEFTFSTGIFNSNQKIDYLGDRGFDGHTSVNVGSTGIVLNLFNKPDGDLKSFNIGVSYNRVNDFNQNIFLLGYNDKNSVTDVFVANTNGVERRFFDIPSDHKNDKYYLYYVRDNNGNYLNANSIMAFQTYLIDAETPDGSSNKYLTALNRVKYGDSQNDNVNQYQWDNIRGFNDVVNIAFGGNVLDVVYVGGSVNITNINYHSSKTYKEEAAAGNYSNPNTARFERLFIDDFYDAYGSGVSLGLGLILKPIQEIRIGVSYQSPTWTSIDENYSTVMTSEFSNVQKNTGPDNSNFYDTPLVVNDYRFSSPQRLTGSLGFVLGSFGIISADVDWVNYASMRMHSNRDNRDHASGVNAVIGETYRNTINARVGGELKLDNYALRAGYQYCQNPYNKDFINSDNATNIYSAGFGYRTQGFYIDFAYSLMNLKDSFSLYEDSGIATSTMNRNSYIMTLGFKF
jgi:hypothetical protein